MSTGEIILITGANTGLGLEIVKALCQSAQRYHILVGCRDISKGQAAIKSVEAAYPSTSSTLSPIQVDLAIDNSIETAINTISAQHKQLDALINNAGAQYDTKISTGEMTIRECFNASWDINVSGTEVLTTLAVPLLLKSSNPRLIFITSGTSTLAETESTATDVLKRLNTSPPAGWPKPPGIPIKAYRSAKCGLNMLMREWTKALANDGVKVWAVSPGFLATGLGGAGPDVLKKVSFPYTSAYFFGGLLIS